MNWIYLGCTAFILLTLFDLNKIYKWHAFLNILFPLSIALLIYALFRILMIHDQSQVFTSNVWFYALVLIGAIEQVYALFFALPANKTYVSLNDIQVIDTGLYALCRHPGVWGFIIMAIGFVFATGSCLVLWAALFWTSFDLLHIWIQDRFIFPISITGYQDYRLRVPFLFFKVKESNSCQNLS